jgi:hypothetical protein
MAKNKKVIQLVWGIALVLAGIGTVFFGNVFHTFLFLFFRCVAYRRGSKKAL